MLAHIAANVWVSCRFYFTNYKALKIMNKEKQIASIKQRILDEYKKHKTFLDWAEIAARKIYSTHLVKEKCNLPVVSPSNLTIRVLNIDIQDFSLDKQLVERNISPDTIISCQSVEDDVMLVYYWG